MSNFKAPLAMSILCALAGCNRDASAPNQPAPAASSGAPAAVAKHPATPEEQTAGMVEAATQGKSQLAAVLKFELTSRPTVGEPLDVGIALIPGIAGASASIAVSASEGLALADGSGRFEIPQVDAAQVYRQSIKVTPNADGVLFLTLTVTLTHDQMSESRVFALPIIVGAPPPAVPAPAAAASAAQKPAH